MIAIGWESEREPLQINLPTQPSADHGLLPNLGTMKNTAISPSTSELPVARARKAIHFSSENSFPSPSFASVNKSIKVYQFLSTAKIRKISCSFFRFFYAYVWKEKKREGVGDDFCLFEVQNKVIGVPNLADAHIVADVHVATKGGRMRPKIKTNL